MLLASYLRRSSKTQNETSPRVQLKSIEAYCELYKHTLLLPQEDVKTGTLIARDGFWVALRSLICHKCDPGETPDGEDAVYKALTAPCKCDDPVGADGLIAYDLDRVGRETKLLLWLALDFFRQKGKDLVVLNGIGRVDTTTPGGRFLFTVMAGHCQFRREDFLEKAWNGKQEKARGKGYACGRPPYGYAASSGKLIPIETEQGVLRKIKALKAEGFQPSQIARNLNRQGILRRNGKPWFGPAVREMLEPKALKTWMEQGCSYNHLESQSV